MHGALLDFDPLRVIKLDQLHLRRREYRVIQRRLTDLAQALQALILRTTIPCYECLTIFEPQLPFIDPDRDTLP